ncbi:MAG: VOC family protein [Maribacter sp.]
MVERKIDHLVYAVTNLEEAIEVLESKLGVRPIIGGHHASLGTKNALILLNEGMYFEILAIDHQNTKVAPPRWMGVDLHTKNQITRWSVTSQNLKKDAEILKEYNLDLGHVLKGSRQTPDGKLLQWELTLPKSEPEVELVPFCIDWNKSETHPSQQLPEMHCELLELQVTHPNPNTFSNIFEKLELNLKVELAQETAIKAIIKCPKGIVAL